MSARERAFGELIPRPDDPKPQSRWRKASGDLLGQESHGVRYWVQNNKKRIITSETAGELARLKRVAESTQGYENGPVLEESGDGITGTLTYPKKAEWNYHQMATAMTRDFGEPTRE